MRTNVDNLVGIGLYTVPEAARLTRVAGRRIRRWLLGYEYGPSEARGTSAPVWRGQIGRVDSTIGLGFLDLLEVRFIDAFRRYGVSWRVIRLTAEGARREFETDHPFSTRRFKTDGRRIFLETVETSGEKKLLDLVRRQFAFHNVVSPSLYEGFEFSDIDVVTRWYPMWPKRRVVVDPRRAFGRPIISREGVPTDILAKAVQVEKSVDRVAKLFDVDREAVRAAVEFERGLAA
jgi:uncharacterized protein (DUF433 family)